MNHLLKELVPMKYDNPFLKKKNKEVKLSSAEIGFKG